MRTACPSADRVNLLNMQHTGPRTNVLIADDHPAMREGLCALLEREGDFNIVAQAEDGMQAVALFRAHRPRLTVLDLHMPRMDGLTAVTAILEEFPQALIVVLTSYEGDARVARALSLGARAYVVKTSHPRELAAALRRVLAGGVSVEARLAKSAGSPKDQLTAREITVVKLVAQGKQNRDIGKSLHVSEHTVKSRIKSVLAKLGANDRTHAVTLARIRGFLDF